MKVAKLVCVSLMTRVIVDENATDEQILEKSKANFIEKISTELGENLESITDDEEVPFEEENQCLNCGFSLKYAEIKNDDLGKHAECPECNMTSDVI